MKCLRYDVSRRLTAYLDGELSERSVRRVERHLLDCLECRDQLVRRREGRSFASRLVRTAPPTDAWHAIEAALDAEIENRRRVPAPGRRVRWIPQSSLSRSGWAVALGLVVVNAALFVRDTEPRRASDTAASTAASDLDRDEFRAVQIADIRDNTSPHIVAEGRVAEVGADEEDGTMTFKLVDDTRPSDSFVVCEVIRPLGITLPPVGSRVRVYGVSRFDNQADHEWYEIHPVLGIEMLQSK